jgi:hypothetical protein
LAKCRKAGVGLQAAACPTVPLKALIPQDETALSTVAFP